MPNCPVSRRTMLPKEGERTSHATPLRALVSAAHVELSRANRSVSGKLFWCHAFCNAFSRSCSACRSPKTGTGAQCTFLPGMRGLRPRARVSLAVVLSSTMETSTWRAAASSAGASWHSRTTAPEPNDAMQRVDPSSKAGAVTRAPMLCSRPHGPGLEVLGPSCASVGQGERMCHLARWCRTVTMTRARPSSATLQPNTCAAKFAEVSADGSWPAHTYICAQASQHEVGPAAAQRRGDENVIDGTWRSRL